MIAARRDRDLAVTFAFALAARLAVVAWAAPRFRPAADGQYYHALAERLALGLGYTWQWPDGAVTAAAHYPVGYPALLAPIYAAFGANAAWAMVLGALLGALAAPMALLLARAWVRGAALTAGMLVAIHPALVPYAAAMMTEAIAGAGLLAAAAIVARDELARPRLRLVLAGLVLGVVTLVRPQCVVLAPVLGFLARGGERLSRRIAGAALVTIVALACCAPWTARNCVAMKRCALVSVNGGWNLLIGTQTESGAWREIEVPAPCRTVWDEAQKDACFEREAKGAIVADPLAALKRVPAKLAVTFDYFGGAPWYLHESNPTAFDDQAKRALGSVDAVTSHAALLAALLAVAWRAHSRVRVRARTIVIVIAALAIASALSRHAAPAYVGFAILIMFAGPYRPREILLPWSAAVVASVAGTHAVFFGAGRYGLVAAPLVAAVAGIVANARSQCQDDGVDAEQAIAGFELPRGSSMREESPSTIEHDAG